MLHYRSAETSDYDTLIALWERSVDATHYFLKDEHKQIILTNLPTYFKLVDVLIWYDSSKKIVGFSGTHDGHLEMLFLDPGVRRRGYGTEIIQFLIQKHGIDSVDVNKQNDQAFHFYQKNGFETVRESLIDGQGYPYPILHMRRRE